MAAVAAAPGAAAPTTSSCGAAEGDGPPEPGPAGPPEPGPAGATGPAGPGQPGAPPDSDDSRERGPASEQPAARWEEDGERRHVRPEQSAGPEEPLVPPGPELRPSEPRTPEPRPGSDRFSPGVPGDTAVFLHSLPAAAPVPEAGLSLAEPAEPTDRDRGYTALRPGPPQDAGPDTGEGGPGPAAPGPGPGPGCVQDLNLGSEVRVCLDHVIDDALVVSFRLGEKVFSGVLMDVTRRFGPYGIPITVFPRRDRPPLPLQSDAIDAVSVKQEDVAAGGPPAPPHCWTSKPPPLFQEGAPYPPPLLIRDTYNQALPQPPPRKIKRPKRRYRSEEPTSIMSAIRLRPRQVLCDKCKGAVASGGHREARRGPVDPRAEEASRRRRAPEGPIPAELKRLRGDDKGGRVTPAAHRVLRGVASAPATTPPSRRVRLKLGAKKVLNQGPADRSKARQVLKKLARNTQPPHRQNQNQVRSQTQNRDRGQNRDQSQTQDRCKAVTRAAALQSHNQKVHFTRRLGAGGLSSALPPRMRLKPQSATSLKSC